MGNLYHPDAFQGMSFLKSQKADKSYFEGWYIKCISADKKHKFAFIPGVFIGREKQESHSFLQILNGSTATYEYIRFASNDFEVLSKNEFAVSLQRNHFSNKEIQLNVNQGNFEIEGSLQFRNMKSFPVKAFSPGIMGPFAFTPFMECYHGLVSLDHEIMGSLKINGTECFFDRGKGYIEKDWGRSFPSAYVWMQSNHFKASGSLFASVAKIPWMTGSFRGFILALYYNDELIRFATYTGARLQSLNITDKKVDLVVSDKKYLLEISASRSQGAILMAPYEHSMLERVSETMTSEIEFKLTNKKTGQIIEEQSNDAALEVQGELADLTGAV